MPGGKPLEYVTYPDDEKADNSSTTQVESFSLQSICEQLHSFACAEAILSEKNTPFATLRFITRVKKA